MENCLLGRNVAPYIFDQKSREKSKSGRNVAGRNVAGRYVTHAIFIKKVGRNQNQGETSQGEMSVREKCLLAHKRQLLMSKKDILNSEFEVILRSKFSPLNSLVPILM